jgi:hypothetical protein
MGTAFHSLRAETRTVQLKNGQDAVPASGIEGGENRVGDAPHAVEKGIRPDFREHGGPKKRKPAQAASDSADNEPSARRAPNKSVGIIATQN